VIDEHPVETEKIIKDDYLVILSDFQKIYTSQNTAYIKAKIKVTTQVKKNEEMMEMEK